MSGGEGVLDRIGAIGVVPVVELQDASAAVALAEALASAGLPLIEITLRTPTAIEAIRAAAQHGGLLVGAGTVVNVAQVDRAVEAGAAFVVSPGISEAVVERCRDHGVPCLPGVATPTEIMTALDLGIETLKLFPAATIGGVPALRAFSGPFPQARFVPTGGIDAESAPAYLAVPSVLAVGGSWMVPRAALAAEDWGTVRRLAEEAVSIGAARGGS
jgi:2-dehydro-3-deoxyphosphogluconate aldolase/(4S)-4-hydroxy-2-oxoglutarate aldolase